jgi:hypothetical protein
MRLLILCLTALSSALLAQWPQFRGNPALTGVAAAARPGAAQAALDLGGRPAV